MHINGNVTQLPRHAWLARWCKPRVRDVYAELARNIQTLMNGYKLHECKFVADDGRPVHWVCLIDTFLRMKNVSARAVMREVVACASEIGPQHLKFFAFGPDSPLDDDGQPINVLWASRGAQIRGLISRKWVDEIEGSCPYVVFDGQKYVKKNGRPIWMKDLVEIVDVLIDDIGDLEKYNIQPAGEFQIITDDHFVGPFE